MAPVAPGGGFPDDPLWLRVGTVARSKFSSRKPTLATGCKWVLCENSFRRRVGSLTQGLEELCRAKIASPRLKFPGKKRSREFLHMTEYLPIALRGPTCAGEPTLG
jgi:hypothetical protein